MTEVQYAEEIEQIEISNSRAKEVVAKGEALKKLLVDPNYITIIKEGFLKEYPEAMGRAIALNTGAYDADKLFECLKGTNVLVGYERQVANNMMAAEQELLDNEEYIGSLVIDGKED